MERILWAPGGGALSRQRLRAVRLSQACLRWLHGGVTGGFKSGLAVHFRR